jgi:aminopeptidase N
MARLDPHSYADASQARTRSFDWKAKVDFDAKVLVASVTLTLDAPAAGGPFDLDTRGLSIESVQDGAGQALPFKLHAAEPIFGSRLEVTLPKGATSIHIHYRTAPDASALQWLTPEQTLGGKQPYLFSQCQAIHARSVVPCQDTPSIRQTYTAELDVPSHLRAVMAAAPRSREEKAGGRAHERFEMPQPIPPYLLAFAVGDLASRDLSPRSRVWAEPAMVDAAAREFDGVEAMMKAAEKLFGPYDWERFDLLVMPPSFPYGGMENPRLTFLTPALITGDKSQVNVVGHELAHSWTGNLVTSSNAEHFWLNEGFTVFAERRILEALEGEESASLHAALGLEELLKTFSQFGSQPGLTKLHTDLKGVDPDEAFSLVPYEKGYFFLKTLEQAAGRQRFDALLKTWLKQHRFGAATTQDFTALVERLEPGLLAKVDAKAWIDAPLLPDQRWRPYSERLEAVRHVAGRVPTLDEAKGWGPTEWNLFLEATPRPLPLSTCRALDERFSLTASKNPEVLVAWLTLACESGDATALKRTEEVLTKFGRMKYLKPLYRALVGRPETKLLARKIFDDCRPRYHPIAQQVIAGVLKSAGA